MDKSEKKNPSSIGNGGKELQRAHFHYLPRAMKTHNTPAQKEENSAQEKVTRPGCKNNPGRDILAEFSYIRQAN